MRADALCRPWRTPGVGAVSCSSTGPGGYRAPGFVSHSLVLLSMALRTSLVSACWGARKGTVRRKWWHAGGDRMGCGAAAVIHLHAVSGTIAPDSTVPMPFAWSSAWPWTRGKYGLGGQASSLHRTQAPPCLQAVEQGHAGEERLRESPLDGLGGMGQGAHGQIPQREDPGAWQRLRLPCVPLPLGVWRSLSVGSGAPSCRGAARELPRG